MTDLDLALTELGHLRRQHEVERSRWHTELNRKDIEIRMLREELRKFRLPAQQIHPWKEQRT
jgi:hypothetical protein